MKYTIQVRLIKEEIIEAKNGLEAVNAIEKLFKKTLKNLSEKDFDFSYREEPNLEDNEIDDDGIKFYLDTESEGYKEILEQVQDLSESRGSKC
mgnify:CR=1 FL=1